MKYKIHITTEDGELLNTIEIDTTETNWDTMQTKSYVADEIFDEIDRDVIRKGIIQ